MILLRQKLPQPLVETAPATLPDVADTDRIIALLLPAVQFAAFWPAWQWVAQRTLDIPENRVGAVALACAASLAGHTALRGKVAIPRLGLPSAFMAVYALALPLAPPHISAALAVASIGCLLGSMLGPKIRAGLVGLLALALPIMPSMQTHIGYPMRLAGTVIVSKWLGFLGFAVEPEGTCLRWGNRLVLVDEPCSGVKMLWAGLVLTCVLAGFRGLNGRRTVAALAGATMLVFAANVFREVCLFFPEAFASEAADGPGHYFIGIVMFAMATLAIGWWVLWLSNRSKKPTAAPTPDTAMESCRPHRARVSIFLTACAISAAVPLLPCAVVEHGTIATQFPGWPTEFDGGKLTPMPLTSMERRYYIGMPGRVARFTDGRRQIVLRWLAERDTKFHLSQRCYRAFGYSVSPLPAVLDDHGGRWGAFEARRTGERIRVRERIWDDAGAQWSDEAAFRWDMFWRRPPGPWWSATIAERDVP